MTNPVNPTGGPNNTGPVSGSQNTPPPYPAPAKASGQLKAQGGWAAFTTAQMKKAEWASAMQASQSQQKESQKAHADAKARQKALEEGRPIDE